MASEPLPAGAPPAPARRLRTVLGDVPTEDMGATLAHEHLLVDLGCYWQPDDDEEIATQRVTFANLARVRRSPWASRDNLRLDDLAGAISEVAAFRRAGGGTIIDVTCQGMGRDLAALRQIAQLTHVHVVGATGYYVAASHPTSLATRSADSLAAEFVSEIVDGDGRTGIRAGVIGEVGAGSFPMTPAEALVVDAAAAAQRQAGVAIVVHPAPGGHESVFELAERLAAAGARMDKVVISHLDERFRNDVAAFRRLADLGCVFGFDTFGREIYFAARRRQHPSDADRIATIVSLFEAGLGDRIVVSQDVCLKIELEALAGQGYSRIMLETVARMRHEGLDEAALACLLTDTPARLFALEPAEPGS